MGGSAKVEPERVAEVGGPRPPTGKKKVKKDLLDVYALLRFEEEKKPFRTETIKDAGRNHLVTAAQREGQTLTIPAEAIGDGTVQILMYDDDELSGDDLIGTCDTNLRKIVNQEGEFASTTVRTSDGAVNYRIKLRFGENNSFAGNVDVILSQGADKSIKIQFVKFLELREVSQVTDLRGLVDMVPVYWAIGMLVLYYIVGCIFYSQYPMALRGDGPSTESTFSCRLGNLTETVTETYGLPNDDLLATCDQSQNDGSSSDCSGFVDAFYFVTATLTTVGYGDMGPNDDGAIAFTLLFALIGTAFVGVSLGIISGYLMDRQEAMEARMKKTGKKKPSPSEEKCKKQCKCCFTSSTQAILRALISLSLTLVIGMIFYYLEIAIGQNDPDSATFINLLYFATITSTTVGYGDESPATIAGRLIGSFYMLFSVAMFGVALSAIADIPLSRRRDKMETKVTKQFGDSLSIVELQNIIRTANDDPRDDSCSKEEFVISMLVKLDKVKPDQIKSLQDTFDSIDVDKSGTLSLSDVTETEEMLLSQDD
mgnify:CR=1 FL=1